MGHLGNGKGPFATGFSAQTVFRSPVCDLTRMYGGLHRKKNKALTGRLKSCPSTFCFMTDECVFACSPWSLTFYYPSQSVGMTCQARTSYTEDEVLWGHRFLPVMSLEEGFFRVDYSQFHSTFEVPTPPYSVKEHEEKNSLPSPLSTPTPALTESHGAKRDRVFSVDCINTSEERGRQGGAGGRLPSKLQRMSSSGKEDLQRKVLLLSSQHSEKACSTGDLPLKLQRLSSSSGPEAENRLQLKSLKVGFEPMTQSTGDLYQHSLAPALSPTPVPMHSPLLSGTKRLEDNLPAKLRKMNADR